MKMISRKKNSHYIVHSTVCRLSFHCIVQVPLVKTHLLCRVLVLRIHSGLKSGGKLQFGKVVLLLLASKAKFNIIFLPICQPIVHISVYYMIQVQLILIKWQLYVTPKKFPDKGVFPFEKGVKKWLFSLISVLQSSETYSYNNSRKLELVPHKNELITPQRH